MTTVSAVMVCSYTGPDMFADLTGGVLVAGVDRAAGVASLTFDADLDAATVRLVKARMLSRREDDSDGAALLDDRDALDPADPLRRLYCYLLGEA